MQIESIEIRNYRLFRLAELKDLPRLTIVVGANGSGKSTLFDVFSFLKEALAQNVASAVARRGGLRELVSRGEKGPIGIMVKFRESGGRLATYQLEIGEDAGRPVVVREVLKFRRGQYGQPWHFVDFSKGKGTAITNEAGCRCWRASAELRSWRWVSCPVDPGRYLLRRLGRVAVSLLAAMAIVWLLIFDFPDSPSIRFSDDQSIAGPIRPGMGLDDAPWPTGLVAAMEAYGAVVGGSVGR